VAYVEGLDFREALWNPRAMNKTAGGWEVVVPEQPGKNGAAFGDLEFEQHGLRYHLSTLIGRVPPLPPEKPMAHVPGKPHDDPAQPH
jgi:hypothetical protein